jgi:tryptophanyl-tRNA synthetase
MSKPVILTGIRANQDLHIGNYFGALLPIVDIAQKHADEYQINLFIPDLHSFTTQIDHSKLQTQISKNLKLFVAAGLPIDHHNVYIYRQSYIPAHSELTWILDCFTSFGEMSRMTQFKDKSDLYDLKETLNQIANHVSEMRNRYGDKYDYQDVNNSYQFILNTINDYERRSADDISVGLFNYPVLMAADILLYGADYVPVGDDQTQHLEFARDIAYRMNKRFNELFKIPKPVKEQHEFFGKDQGLRIRDLQNPIKKMSKSSNSEKGTLFLNDQPDIAKKKVLGSETDSLGEINYDYNRQPGISNLLDLLTLLGGNKENYIGQKQYGPLKDELAGRIVDFLRNLQTKVDQVDETKIHNKLIESEAIMNKIANDQLLKVQKAVGLRS